MCHNSRSDWNKTRTNKIGSNYYKKGLSLIFFMIVGMALDRYLEKILMNICHTFKIRKKN